MPQKVKADHEEKLVLQRLAEAWNCFLALEPYHPDENDEFRRAIHAAQSVIAVRIASRIDKDIWSQPPPPYREVDLE